MSSRTLMFGLAPVLAAVIASPAARACAVCFGRTDSPLGKGVNWGVFVLLAFIGLMLAAVGAFFVYIIRRSTSLEREDAELNSASATTTSPSE